MFHMGDPPPGSEVEAEEQTNHKLRPRGIKHCDWFILQFLLAIPTMHFSLDRKQQSHKRNQCSASVSLIFTRSYHSTLLITTPTTTPSLVLVKTSL